MKTFKINDYIEIVCEWKKTRNAFKHEATLLINGIERETTKICYLNRTWESYEFESVIEKLAEKSKLLTKEEKELILSVCSGKSKAETDSMFKGIAMVAKMGEIFGSNQKEKNDWKARMLKAGLGNKGLDMPEDWDSLSENDKQIRLDGAIKQLS